MAPRSRKSEEKPMTNSGRRLSGLPTCYGPKLDQFEHHHLPVHFIQLLSDPEAAAHSHVFEVNIGAHKYALKVFRFYDIAEDEFGLNEIELEDPDLILQVDPFFAECRAFGRIKEKDGNGILAVECLGYLHIPAIREAEMDQKFEELDWNRPSEEYEMEPSERTPFRAIVKRLISSQTTWNAATARGIKRNLKALNAAGVYVFDIDPRNFVGGQLVDLSVSWTEPHVLFRTRHPLEIKSRRKTDLSRFDVMMEDLQIRNAPRALPNPHYLRKLRSNEKP